MNSLQAINEYQKEKDYLTNVICILKQDKKIYEKTEEYKTTFILNFWFLPEEINKIIVKNFQEQNSEQISILNMEIMKETLKRNQISDCILRLERKRKAKFENKILRGTKTQKIARVLFDN